MLHIYDEFTRETAKKFPWRIDQVDYMLTIYACAGTSPEDATAWLELIAQGKISFADTIIAAVKGAKPTINPGPV